MDLMPTTRVNMHAQVCKEYDKTKVSEKTLKEGSNQKTRENAQLNGQGGCMKAHINLTSCEIPSSRDI